MAQVNELEAKQIRADAWREAAAFLGTQRGLSDDVVPGAHLAASALRWRAGQIDQQPDRDTGSISDGYHTFDELYEYRMLYNAHAARGWLDAGIPVVKSWRHSDGELCFGQGGWFIVTAELPTGQVSNHYPQEAWELFEVPEVERAPEWDGHTPGEAAQRLRAALGDENGDGDE